MHISITALILAIATIVGGIAAILTFLPRVSITPSDPVDPINPFSASFTIINSNFIPLKKIDVSIGIGQIVTEPAKVDLNFIPSFSSRLVMPHWQHHDLSMDERFTITISDLIKMPPPLSGADIGIVVTYQPWILPLRREKLFRFVAKKQSNNQFYWYSLPLNEPIPSVFLPKQ